MKKQTPLVGLFFSLIVLLGFAYSLFPLGEYGGGSPSNQDLTRWQPYLHYLKEFYQRRRVNVYFRNDQSIFYGTQVNFVNVGRGNLTFVRRDLVTGGRIPLVVARVYDSAGRGSLDLGPGWHISATERIEVQGGRARLYSETGAEIDFVLVGAEFRRARQFPSDYKSLVITPSGTLEVATPNGFTREYSLIGDAYRLTHVADRHENAVRLTYAGSALSRMENGGHFVEFTRDEEERVVSVGDDRGRRVSYSYDANGRLVQVTDIGGNIWRYEYTSENRLHTALDPLYRLNFKAWYQGDGRVRRLELPSGRIEYQYDDATRSTTVVDRKDLISRYYQNQEGITLGVTNPLGEETRIVLDGNRNASELWESGVMRHRIEYDSEHRVILRGSSTPAGELTAQYAYDPATGKLARIQYSDGRAESFDYDATGNLMAWSSSQHGVRNYEWSPSGDLTRVSRAETGETLELAYGADGAVSQAMEAGERTTSFGYEGRMQPSQITFAQGDVVRLKYDQLGLRRGLEFKEGWSGEYTFDPAGNLVASSVTEVDGNRRGQTLELDDSYQLVRRVFQDGTEARYQYDKNGNLLKTVDGAIVTRFEYDALNRLTAIVTHEGERLEYEYAPGEPSLIAQSDAETGWLPGERWDTGQTFARQREVFATRTYAVPLGAVRFSETLGRFQLSGEMGGEILTPELAVEAPLRKLRLWGEGHHNRHDFLAASNLLFQPPEYATVNCCPICGYQGGGEWDCDDPCGGLPPQQASVIIAGPGGGPPPSNVALRAPGSTGPNEIEFQAEGTPEGGTYAWSNLDMDKVDLIVLSGTASESPNRAKVVAKAQSASQFDVQIQVDYEAPNALPAAAVKDITVQKPTSLSLAFPGSTVAESCPAGQAGPHREVDWQARDQFSANMQFAGMPVSDVGDFIITSQNCSVGGVQTGTDLTSSAGQFHDTYRMCSPVCGSGQSCQLNAAQTWTVNGFKLTGDVKNIVFTCSQITLNGQ